MEDTGAKVLEHTTGNTIEVSTVATVLVPVLLMILLMLYAHGKFSNRLPPGPRPVWPIVGNFPALRGHDLPHLTFQKLAARYGGLMYLRLGSMPCIVISTSAVAQEVFQSKAGANFLSRPKRLACTIISRTTEYRNVSLTPYGPYWRQLRKFFSKELFSPKRHASYESARTEEIRIMAKEIIHDSHKGDAVDLRNCFKNVTANIMTRMLVNKRLFGKGLEIDQKETEDFDAFVSRCFEDISAFVISDYIPYLNFITKWQGWPSKFKNLRDHFESTLLPKIFDLDNHKKRAKENKGNNGNIDYVPNFVDLLLATPLEADGKPLSDKDLTMLLLDIFMAGARGAAASTTEWALAELIVRPDLLKQAQEELDKVVGNNRLVQESDLPNLPFLNAIVKETFRFHPPAPLSVPRESIHPSQVLGYYLPARTTLILNLYSIHRDASVYHNPNDFNPKRFLEQPEVNHLSGVDFYQLIPFGVGQRMCPGNNLGNSMVSMMLASLLHSFDWSLPQGERVETFDMSEVFAVTSCRKNPLFLVAKPRSSATLLY